MKKIILNADDLGFSSSVNQAILELAQMERLSSASYMVYGKIDEATCQQLDATSIKIGLHLDLTSPFCPYSQPLKYWITESFFSRLSLETLQQYCTEQLQLFAQTWQRPPAFIDGHQHVHQFKLIRTAWSNAWYECFGQTPLWVRSTRPKGLGVKSWIIYALGGRALERIIQQNQWQSNLYFSGVYHFEGTIEDLEQYWRAWLLRCNDGTLFMCHPAQDGEQVATDDIALARVREWQWLKSQDFANLLLENQTIISKII